MNYYNPYFGMTPYVNPTPRVGLFSRLFGNLNFSSILSGTQKTLNIINQSIPIIKQAKPIVNNAKTMLKVMNEFKKSDANIDKNVIKERKNDKVYSNSPTFFA